MSSTLEDMLRWQAFLAAPPSGRRTAARAHGGAGAVPRRVALDVRARARRRPGTAGCSTSVTVGASPAADRSRCASRPPGWAWSSSATATTSRRTRSRAASPTGCSPTMLEPFPDGGPLLALSRAAGLYRQEGGDDVFEIVAGGGTAALGAEPAAPLLVTSGGPVTIEHVEEGVFAPESAHDHLTFGLPRDGVIPARWCGVPRTLPPAPPGRRRGRGCRRRIRERGARARRGRQPTTRPASRSAPTTARSGSPWPGSSRIFSSRRRPRRAPLVRAGTPYSG